MRPTSKGRPPGLVPRGIGGREWHHGPVSTTVDSIEPPSRRRQPISRTRDRAITTAGVFVSALFLAAAAASAFVGPGFRHGIWLPLHLALAGGATTAIAAALPFFARSLLAAPPAPASLRASAIALVSLGASAVALGVSGQGGAIGSEATPLGPAPIGGLAFVAGVVVVGWSAIWTVRGSVGTRYPIVLFAYSVALAEVAIGAILATLYLAGYPPVAGDWAHLMPAHAWLNLLGFVSLTVAATLVHLYPTILGTRIPLLESRTGRVGAIALSCLTVGPILVALGYGLDAGLLVRAGALIEIAGAASFATYGLAVWQRRGRWTTDGGWHLAIAGHLGASIGWLSVGVGLAGLLALVAGADPSGWSIEAVIAPLALGGVVQAIIGSWTHLVPSIGPGDVGVHARQRSNLARAAALRLAVFQLAALLLLVGLPSGIVGLVVAGTVLATLGVAGSLGLLLEALVQARSWFRLAFRDGTQRL